MRSGANAGPLVKRSLVALLFLFALIQVPFTYVGLTVAAREGLRYLDIWRLIVAGPQQRSEREAAPTEGAKSGASEPAPALSPGPEAQPADETVRAIQSPAVAEPLDETGPPVGLTRRQVGDLPAFASASALAWHLPMLRGVPVAYVSVPPRPLRSLPDETPLVLRLRREMDRRTIVLAGRPGLSWWFQGELAEGLAGVLVLSSGAEPGDQIIGLPETLPVARIDIERDSFPFVRSVVPSCLASENPLEPFACSNVGEGEQGPETVFQRAERSVRALLGSGIASVSSAFADGGDRFILLPEEIADEASRERARSYLERYGAAKQAVQRYRETQRSYARRFLEERREAVIREVAKHPPYRLGDIEVGQPRLMVVSAYEGQRRPATAARREDPVLSYQAYADEQRSKIGSVIVEVTAAGPLVVVVTAHRATDWQFRVAPDVELLGVHVEGIGAPTISGVPDSVPLQVRSRAFGDRDSLGYLKLAASGEHDDRAHERDRGHLAGLKDLYQPTRTLLYGDYRLERVLLADGTATPEPGR